MRGYISAGLLLGLFILAAACSPQDAEALPPRDTLPAETLSFSRVIDPSKATAIPSQSLNEEPPDEPAANLSLEPTLIGPVITATITAPPPVKPVNLSEEVEALVLLGTDYESPHVGRTDTIILVLFHRQTGNASLISVPRDLFIYQPDGDMVRINTVFSLEDPELIYDALEYNLGVRPQHWVLAHLDDFIRFVDDLGGIDVQVSRPLPHDCRGIPPGEFHMDGEVALCYVRERQTTSDFDRSKRQQEVLRVLFDRFFTLENLLKLPEWYRKYSGTIQSDMDFLDLINYLPLALHLQDGGGIHHFQIDSNDVNPWIIPATGASVLLPNRYKIEAVVEGAMAELSQPVPTSVALVTRIALLTTTPTATVTPLATTPPPASATPTTTETPLPPLEGAQSGPDT
jgi:LCP family protein required for cell wall assembly